MHVDYQLELYFEFIFYTHILHNVFENVNYAFYNGTFKIFF